MTSTELASINQSTTLNQARLTVMVSSGPNVEPHLKPILTNFYNDEAMKHVKQNMVLQFSVTNVKLIKAFVN